MNVIKLPYCVCAVKFEHVNASLISDAAVVCADALVQDENMKFPPIFVNNKKCCIYSDNLHNDNMTMI